MADGPRESVSDERPAGQGEPGTLVAFPGTDPNKSRPLDNLPLELSSFVGRESEVAEVERLLAGGDRLLTLYGPGGCGKTRLALAAAQEMVEGFEDGVWWVEMAPISDPQLAASAVASTLGVREMPDRSAIEVLGEHLRNAKALLILDNCEHLVEACAGLADTLLRACPTLQILATSREPLRVAGETVWTVPSLSLPDPQRRLTSQQLASYEAVRLFVERARASDAGFTLTDQNAPVVARLCRKLEGIPLAIELAAARVRSLTVEQISERLEDPLSLLTTGSRTAAPRHRTLRAALEWSYDLLEEGERNLFERLSVFAGGWDLEAAEAVGAGGSVRPGMVLDLLSALVDRSLVMAEESAEVDVSRRYRMLVPVKHFAREKLEERAEADNTRQRHARHYVAFAERAEPELLGPDQGLWLGRLRTEAGNLRAAFSWSVESGPEEAERAELRLRLVAALCQLWGREGFEEGKRWLRAALDRDPGGFPAARAKSLSGLGFILLFQQDYGTAIEALEEAIALYRELGDETGAALALGHLGYAALHGNYRERVAPFVEEGEKLIKGDVAGPVRAYLQIVLAAAAQGNGDIDSAVTHLEEALALCRETGSLREVGMSLFILGNLEISREDLDRGAALLDEGARVSRELGDILGAAYYVWGFGRVAVLRNEPVRAARLWGAAETIREKMGMSLSHYDLTASGYERDLASVRSELDEATFEAAWSEGRFMSLQAAIAYALEQQAPAGLEGPAEPSASAPSAAERRDEVGQRHNLPKVHSSFVGRERVMSEVKNTLSRTRLLTLTGAGGCGKTRLALEVALEVLDDYPDGVWLVQLASLTQGELVPDAVAAALGLHERPGLSFTEALVDYLRSRRVLIVMDNCEHLIGASARLVDTLLGSCEQLRILATSREALGVAGEVNWLIPSLTVPEEGDAPDPRDLARYEAVELFVERARSRLPAFELTRENAAAVAEICRKLDGIPLAIELATGRMGALTVDQIAARLEDTLGFLTSGDRTKPPRHQTLRAALEWSYDLLEEEERGLFEQLSVFAGGWDLEAAEAIGASGSVETARVLDLLATLVDKSLVLVEAPSIFAGSLRYRMLEPVRQYALELLERGGGADATRKRHAVFFASLAEEAYPNLRAAPQVEWLERLQKEIGNLRGALSWALSAGETVTAARVAWSVWPFWWMRNHQPEGRRWLEMVLQKKEELPLRLKIEATVAAEVMAYGQRDEEAVLRYARDLVELSRLAGGDAKAEAYARAGRGLVATTVRGDLETATQILQEALPLFREAEEYGLAAQTLVWLGTIRLLQGDLEGARRGFEEGLAAGQDIGDRMSVNNALFNLAQLALYGGDHATALRRFAEGISLSRELGDRGNIAHILEGLAAVSGAGGDAVRAAQLRGASDALISAIGLRGHTYYQFDRSIYERINGEVRAALGEKAYEEAFSDGQAMSVERAIEYALEVQATPQREQIRPPDPAPSAAELRIFALGRARVERGGRPLPPSPDWIHKPRELLFYLLSHPEGRTKEQIGLALWPDASTSQLRSSFHDTVFRLRRALGAKEWVSFAAGRYAFGGPLPRSFDVEEFRRSVSEAEELRSSSPDDAIGRLQRAAELYGGDFLEDSAFGEWAMEVQDELRREHQDALMLLGRLLYAEGRFSEAASAYRGALGHDEFSEEAHRGLMRSHAALGERGRALRHYDELEGLLEEQLGTSPAPETMALYKRLRAGREVS